MRGPLCFYKAVDKMSIEFYKAYINYMQMTQAVAFYDNPDCVKSIITNLYWTAKDVLQKHEESKLDANLSTILIVVASTFVVMFVLLVIYFNKKGKEETGETREKENVEAL